MSNNQTQKDNPKAPVTPPPVVPAPASGAKPPEGAKAATPPTEGTKPPEGATPPAEETKRTPKEIYICFVDAGKLIVKPFANARDAEKFLNTDAAAPAEFKVIKGNLIEKKQKVSLR